MERALDPELIRLALGEKENLPSPQELANILADAELALLVQNPSISDETIATGWFLHGLASSKFAQRTYGVARQRAAFRVAGHIFDLVLQAAELSWIERLKYVFAAQVSYIRSEIDPNSIALYRRECSSDMQEPRLLSSREELALSCGVALLGFDISYVYDRTRAVASEMDTAISSWGIDDLSVTPFAAAAYVATGTRDFLSFLIYGRQDLLERSRERLLSAVLSESSSDDSISRWVAAHLLNLTGDIENSSVWTSLPPDVPPDVRRAFISGQPRILTLWPPQIKIFGELKDVNPLSSQAKRMILTMPTSGGKSLLAQLLIASHIASSNTSVCYVAPTRSLCREVRKSLEGRLRFIGAQTFDGLPEGVSAQLFGLLDEPGVEVMTPERLSFLLRSDSQSVLEHFGLFVIDEAHLVGEKGRGWTLEEDLSYLHYATQESNHRIVLISAAIGNRNHFVQWMTTKDGEPLHVHSEWRGPRRVSAIWTTYADWAESEAGINPRARLYPYYKRCPLYGNLQVRVSHTGSVRSIRTTQPVGTLALKGPIETQLVRDGSNSTPFYRMLMPLIQHLVRFGPVLVVESTKPATLRMAKAIAENEELVESVELRNMVDLVVARLGEDHPLKATLEKGVAYHHGSLPGEIRVAIEEGVTRGLIRVLVATTTMTEGVNLPVTSVVVASQGSYGREGFEEYITGPKLINAIGRAGRAAKETEGIVVLARNDQPSRDDFQRLNPPDEENHVTSMLATSEALAALALFEDYCRDAIDAVFETTEGSVADFLRFVWFLAAELERINVPPDETLINEMLQRSLGWLQLDDLDRSRWQSVANLGLSRFLTTPPATRRRWATSGTTISSASTLEIVASELVPLLEAADSPLDALAAITLIFGEGRLDRILELPEAPSSQAYSHRGGTRQQIEVDFGEFLVEWVRGTSLVGLADRYLRSVPDIDFRFEQLGDLINDYFEVFFPWVTGLIVSWTNEMLALGNSEASLPGSLPANIRFGVDNDVAIELMVRGLPSRSLAMRIAAAWSSGEREATVTQWLRALDLSDHRDRFGATPQELRDILELCRVRRGGAAVELLSQQFTELEVETMFHGFQLSGARLLLEDHTQLSIIQIWVGEQQVGNVFSKDQADVRSIIEAGLDYTAHFAAEDGSGKLLLTLEDID